MEILSSHLITHFGTSFVPWQLLTSTTSTANSLKHCSLLMVTLPHTILLFPSAQELITMQFCLEVMNKPKLQLSTCVHTLANISSLCSILWQSLSMHWSTSRVTPAQLKTLALRREQPNMSFKESSTEWTCRWNFQVRMFASSYKLLSPAAWLTLSSITLHQHLYFCNRLPTGSAPSATSQYHQIWNICSLQPWCTYGISNSHSNAGGLWSTSQLAHTAS